MKTATIKQIKDDRSLFRDYRATTEYGDIGYCELVAVFDSVQKFSVPSNSVAVSVQKPNGDKFLFAMLEDQEFNLHSE